MKLLKDYLKKIYGEAVYDILKENKEEFKGCDVLLEIFRKDNFKVRRSPCKRCNDINPSHQDFPGWIGNLEYNEGKIYNKNILIFGLEISPYDSVRKAFNKHYYKKEHEKLNKGDKIPTVHIAYELGFLKDNESLVKSHKLWKILNYLLPLEKILNRIYITDIAKCFSDDKIKAQENCTEYHFFEELKHFSDENIILILQGRRLKDFFKNSISFTPNTEFIEFLKENQEILKTYSINCNNPNFEVGEFEFIQKIHKNGKYLCLPHSSSSTNPLYSEFFKIKSEQEDLFHIFRDSIVRFLEM